MQVESRVETEGQRLSIVGRFGLGDFHRALAALHNMTTKRGYQDLVLDFEACTSAFNGPMISLATTVGACAMRASTSTSASP